MKYTGYSRNRKRIHSHSVYKWFKWESGHPDSRNCWRTARFLNLVIRWITIYMSIVCTSIYGMDAHRFWQTPRFIDMEIRRMPMEVFGCRSSGPGSILAISSKYWLSQKLRCQLAAKWKSWNALVYKLIKSGCKVYEEFVNAKNSVTKEFEHCLLISPTSDSSPSCHNCVCQCPTVTFWKWFISRNTVNFVIKYVHW